MADHCAGVFYDGVSSRRREVTVRLAERLEIIEGSELLAVWSYDDLRRLDALPGALKLRSAAGSDLASLTMTDAGAIAALQLQAKKLTYDGARPATGTLRIVLLSLAAAVSIVGVALYGVPKLARAISDVMPVWAERRLGEAAAGQVKTMFGGTVCSTPAGDQALAKLSTTLASRAGLRHDIRIQVLSSRVPNAVALPGGQIYVFEGLLSRARHSDEIAGVLGHEIGHAANRDGLRGMIEAGGTAFLLGLLFGDISGSTALLLVVREMINSSHSREAESAADDYGRQLMHALGRPAAPMAEILTRIDPSRAGEKGSIFDSHPLTAERLKRLQAADANPPRPLDGPELLSQAGWQALKGICAKAEGLPLTPEY